MLLVSAGVMLAGHRRRLFKVAMVPSLLPPLKQCQWLHQHQWLNQHQWLKPLHLRLHLHLHLLPSLPQPPR